MSNPIKPKIFSFYNNFKKNMINDILLHFKIHKLFYLKLIFISLLLNLLGIPILIYVIFFNPIAILVNTILLIAFGLYLFYCWKIWYFLKLFLVRNIDYILTMKDLKNIKQNLKK